MNEQREGHNYAVTWTAQSNGTEHTRIIGTYSAQEAAEYVASLPDVATGREIMVRKADETIRYRVHWIAEPIS